MASRFSRAAFLLPGRLTMSVCPTTPQTARESMACGVLASDAALIASASPGAALSISIEVASGVTSRGEKPVPPTVTTRSMEWPLE